MSKLRCHISMSLDGFVAGPNQSAENPLGVGGEQLHDWVVPLAAFREAHGEQGGTPVFQEATANTGAALEQAKEAAGGKDVMLWGGGQVIGQYLAAGLLDELELHVVPLLLGGGSSPFADLTGTGVRLEQIRAVEAPGVTHLKYRTVTS
jgi:riboflavin biosynthesis pyrimidine reductase